MVYLLLMEGGESMIAQAFINEYNATNIALQSLPTEQTDISSAIQFADRPNPQVEFFVAPTNDFVVTEVETTTTKRISIVLV